MRRSKADSLLYKRGLPVLMIGCMMLHLGGCSRESWYYENRQELPTQSESSGRKLALEEIESRADEYAAGSTEEAEDLVFDEEVISLKGSCDYAYRQLSGMEQLWYADMVQAICTMTDKVKLSETGIEGGLDERNVDKIFQCVLSDHPEFFYVEGYTYTKYSRAEKTVAIDFSGSYNLDRQAVIKRKEEIETAADDILARAPRDADDYAKTKYVYETLITDTDYDLKAEDNQNIYSVFVRHSSVCQGYAKAAQYLLNRMGVECMLVQGTVMETGESHAWNLVKMDGEYYYLDTTWGDISYQGEDRRLEGNIPQISYDYLNITTDQLQRTHGIDALIRMPDCTAQRDNYYVREGAMFEDYDKEQLRELVEKLLAQGRGDIAVRCTTEDCYRAMYDALVERQEIFDCIPGDEVSSFAYTTNDKQLTMTFFMMTSNR